MGGICRYHRAHKDPSLIQLVFSLSGMDSFVGNDNGEMSTRDRLLVVGNICLLLFCISVVSSVFSVTGIGRNILNGCTGKSRSFRLGGIMGRALYP